MTISNKGPRDDRWYLNIMAPNTKTPNGTNAAPAAIVNTLKGTGEKPAIKIASKVLSAKESANFKNMASLKPGMY